MFHLKVDKSNHRVDSLIFDLSLQGLESGSGRSVNLISFLNLKYESSWLKDVLMISYGSKMIGNNILFLVSLFVYSSGLLPNLAFFGSILKMKEDYQNYIPLWLKAQIL